MLPPEVFEVLRDAVEAMGQGQVAMIAPVHRRLTTRSGSQACDATADGGQVRVIVSPYRVAAQWPVSERRRA